MCGMIWSMLWALQAPCSAFNIGYDSKYAELLTPALAAPETNHVLCNIACGLRQLLCLKSKSTSEHVLGHSGHPWNELADCVCTAVPKGSVSLSNDRVPDFIEDNVSPNVPEAHWCFLEGLSPDARRQHPSVNDDGSFMIWNDVSQGMYGLPTVDLAGKFDASPMIPAAETMLVHRRWDLRCFRSCAEPPRSSPETQETEQWQRHGQRQK